MAAGAICLGDHVTLFCEDSSGFVVNFQSGSNFNHLYAYKGQDDKKHPQNVPSQHAITFQICARNRFKITKKYTKYKALYEKDPDNLAYKREIDDSKAAAEAEQAENEAEQKRQHGRNLRYGQIIQLRHSFTQKYIHVSTTQTSMRDKNSMMVSLIKENAKHAQFLVKPRYKVKSEGDIVQDGDQICLESIKSPSHYLHSSAPWEVSLYLFGCELNLGVQATGFTIGKFSHPTQEEQHLLRGGSVIRLFHRETECYMVAEGLFHDRVSEDVHLRVRPLDQGRPHSLFPSTSSATYWQVEPEASFTNGDVIKWGQNIRLRHMTTRLYLFVSGEGSLGLTDKGTNVNTVFRLHPVIQERNDVEFESYCRIENVMTKRWIHSLKGTFYERQDDGTEEVKVLRWDTAVLCQVEANSECQYDDAYTIQEVNERDLMNFNWVAGIVPCILNLIRQTVSQEGMTRRIAVQSTIGLKNLRDFLFVNGVPNKNRQKLLRNLKVVDLLVRYLKTAIPRGDLADLVLDLHVAAYNVLEAYLLGNSRKNELYFARHIDYFTAQFNVPGQLGFRATTMITELIRDNRKIVDRMSFQDMDYIVGLVRGNKNHRFLDLLSVLCVCDGVAIPEYQSYITQKWLEEDNTGVFLTELGENIGRNSGQVYVCKTQGGFWIPLHEFCDFKVSDTTDEEYKFLESQLNLFGQLCFQRNSHAIDVITKKLGYLTWEEAFTCLKEERMPDDLRARYCTLITVLFVDVEGNRPVLDQMTMCYVYKHLGDKTIDKKNFPASTLEIFQVLRDWLSRFLDRNKDMTASDIGHNLLIEQVLRLLHQLVSFGYYEEGDDVQKLLQPLLSLLDGRNDKPYTPSRADGEDYKRFLRDYRATNRFKESPQATAIVDAKCSAMDAVDLLLNLQFNNRLEKFAMSFKDRSLPSKANKRKSKLGLSLAHKEAHTNVKRIVSNTSYFKVEEITAILLDLSKYEYDKIVVKSLALLNRFYSSFEDLFNKAIDAQVLTTDESIRVHMTVARRVPILKQVARAKMSDDDCQQVCEIMEEFKTMCQLTGEPDERHLINQSILVNHGILDLVFELLSQKIDVELLEQYSGTQAVLKHTLRFLRALTKGNTRVQELLYSRFDSLLLIEGVESDLAQALTEVFTGNQTTCLKIRPIQIKKIVDMAAQHQERAPELLDLLCAVVKVEELNLPLKRNQSYVMTNVMENYHRVVYMLEIDADTRYQILLGHKGLDPQSYLVSLIDLISTCTEGENQFIESLAQRACPVEELIRVLNDPEVENNLKRPYLRYLLWSYMNTAMSLLESGIVDLPARIQPWLQSFSAELDRMTAYVQQNARKASLLLKKPIPKSTLTVDDNVGKSIDDEAYGTLHFFFDAALPFIEVFYRKGFNFDTTDTIEATNRLALALQRFNDVARPILCDKHHVRALVQAQISLLAIATVELSSKAYNDLLAAARSGDVQSILSPAQETFYDYYRDELYLNRELNTYALETHQNYRGQNTVHAQIGFLSQREYSEIGGDEDLPLGEEFQDFVRIFIDPSAEDKYCNAIAVVKQLTISANRMTPAEYSETRQVALDVKCLQILRTLIHNEERKLPAQWQNSLASAAGQRLVIKKVQDSLDNQRAILDTLPLITRPQDSVVREYLALVAAMLLDAHQPTQMSLSKYFLGCREELFFTAIQKRLELSQVSFKEKRFLAAQYQARKKQAAAQVQTLMTTMGRKKVVDRAVQDEGKKMKKEDMEYGFMMNGKPGKLKSQRKIPNRNNPKLQDDDDDDDDDKDPSKDHALVEQKDEGNIELVLRVLAGMCDGQYVTLQNYLREQPDNMRSVNLVSEVCAYLSMQYAHISKANMELIIQIFETLNECSVGNPRNHVVIYDNNAIDFINYILRMTTFEGCSDDKILELKDIIGKLLMSIVEENHEDSVSILKEIRETLDFENILRTCVAFYEESKNRARTEEEREDYLTSGFLFYFLLERLNDITEHDIIAAIPADKMTTEALRYYRSNTRSVEVVKDDKLHVIRFRVLDHKILREEVKEAMKWNVDRSSPSNKVRDLMEWSKDIIDDIYYQRRMRSNKISDFFIKNWNVFNNMCIFLSLVINIIMLVVWDAPTGGAIKFGNTDVPTLEDLDGSVPDFPDWYQPTVYGLGAFHNLFSILVFISFFLSSRPAMPDKGYIRQRIRVAFTREKIMVKRKKSRLRKDLFSFLTLYYVAFVLFSALGTAYYGYFFAFHLLNIVYNNVWLKRVILAVTLNGRSLLWVAVLAAIVIYIFSLLAFALFRANMNANNEPPVYCTTLYECTVTVARYGLVGDLFEFMQPHSDYMDFRRFAINVVFHLIFFVFVTLIGLNIVLGIILDTFSELRSNKLIAEEDMRSCCFICGRDSYEFETHAKGFRYHVSEEHNMWSYIFFLIHLEATKYNDLTTLELEVVRLMKNGVYDFFPVGRAMALSTKDQDVVMETLDVLKEKLSFVEQKMLQQEEERNIRKEKEKQLKWEMRHRAGSLTQES